MQPLLKTATLFTAGCALAATGLTHSAGAATVFEVNTSGNAAALEGDGAGDTTALPLSAADGGGTINLTSTAVFNGTSAQTLGMDATGLGIGNSKWGNGPQGWTFTFDKPVSFDGIGFNAAGGSGEGVFIQTDAWIGAVVDASSENWTFDSTVGAFNVKGGNGPLFDFTSAGVSDVAAGDEITIQHNSGNGGSQMTQFTITPTSTTIIPTPSAMLLGVVGLGGLALRRRRG